MVLGFRLGFYTFNCEITDSGFSAMLPLPPAWTPWTHRATAGCERSHPSSCHLSRSWQNYSHPTAPTDRSVGNDCRHSTRLRGTRARSNSPYWGFHPGNAAKVWHFRLKLPQLPKLRSSKPTSSFHARSNFHLRSHFTRQNSTPTGNGCENAGFLARLSHFRRRCDRLRWNHC